MGTLKGYVSNKARVEGSIAEAYIVNECLTFCSMYLSNIETRFNRQDRNYDGCQQEHVGRLSIFLGEVRLIGAPKYYTLTQEDLQVARKYILNNCVEIEKYFE